MPALAERVLEEMVVSLVVALDSVRVVMVWVLLAMAVALPLHHRLVRVVMEVPVVMVALRQGFGVQSVSVEAEEAVALSHMQVLEQPPEPPAQERPEPQPPALQPVLEPPPLQPSLKQALKDLMTVFKSSFKYSFV